MTQVQRWTGAVSAHEGGGFVAYGDYLSLLNRLEKAEKDAARYRWLRNGPLVDGEICEELYVAVDSPAWPGKWALIGSDLDKAVDAMEAK